MSFFILMSQMQQADRLSIPIFMGRNMNDVCFPLNVHIYLLRENILLRNLRILDILVIWLSLKYAQVILFLVNIFNIPQKKNYIQKLDRYV